MCFVLFKNIYRDRKAEQKSKNGVCLDTHISSLQALLLYEAVATHRWLEVSKV